jgi:Ni/Co efflux regulator RcnB
MSVQENIRNEFSRRRFVCCEANPEDAMRKLMLIIATVSVAGLALPVVTSAQANETVVIKSRHHDHGRHLDWERGRHEGLRHSHAEGSKVIIKKNRHFD